jgi:hypothetical protein
LDQGSGRYRCEPSRIATFSGIRLTGAGAGRTLFKVLVPELDGQGNPIFNQDGIPILKEKVFEVPGSGIFTFHPEDPQPLVFPVFNDPEINALVDLANREGFFGRDVTAINEQPTGCGGAPADFQRNGAQAVYREVEARRHHSDG